MELQAERLRLRPLAAGDFDAFAAMAQDPLTTQFLTLDGKPPSREMAWRSFAMMVGHWSLRGFGFFSVFERESGRWVGRVGPWMPEGWPGLECGWGIDPAFRGKGYAAEAAIAAIRWVFSEKPGLPRIISLIVAENANSQAVARKIGENRTDEIYMLEHHRCEIWAAERAAWLERFG
jgi:RimJ/RimL family protein N-acetyltransferase